AQTDVRLEVVRDVDAVLQPRLRVRRRVRVVRVTDRAVRDAQVLELLRIDVVANLARDGEPSRDEDAEADAEVEADLRIEIELAVVRVDDRNRPRRNRADAAGRVEVVAEDEAPEPGELSVDRNVREV